MRDVLAAATAYAAAGFAVHPCCGPDHGCATPGKVPLDPTTGRHAGAWQTHGIPTAAEIAAWRRAPHGPGANLGALTGCGRVWCDIDGPAGEQRLREILGGDPPPTWEYRRGSESRRLIYTVELAPVPTEGRDAGHAGLRLMGDGGQAVLPPSLHVSGDRYCWVEGRTPRQGAPTAAPAALVEHLRGVAARKARAATVAPPVTVATPERLSRRVQDLIDAGAPEGQRSEALATIETAMVAAGYGDDDIIAALLARPWIGAMRPNMERWLTMDLRRLRATGARPDVLDPAPAADAGAAFARLTVRTQGQFAGDGKARARGAVEAVRAGLTVEQVCTVLLATGDGDLDEARGLARWAARAAAGGGRRAG